MKIVILILFAGSGVCRGEESSWITLAETKLVDTAWRIVLTDAGMKFKFLEANKYRFRLIAYPGENGSSTIELFPFQKHARDENQLYLIFRTNWYNIAPDDFYIRREFRDLEYTLNKYIKQVHVNDPDFTLVLYGEIQAQLIK